MCVSASRSDETVIDEDDLVVALRCLSKAEEFLQQTTRLIQMTEVGKEEQKVYGVIERKGVVDYSTLLRNVSYCINAKRLQEIIDTLIGEEKIEEFISNGKRHYRLKGG